MGHVWLLHIVVRVFLLGFIKLWVSIKMAMGLQRIPLAGAGTPGGPMSCEGRQRKRACTHAPNIGCPKRRKIRISLVGWWNWLAFGTDVALSVSKPVTPIIWTSSSLMSLKRTAGQRWFLYRIAARIAENVCDTHLLPFKTHCGCVKSQCFQTSLTKVDNCKGRLYARAWKMCNTPIGYRRVRVFQWS